MFLTKSIRAYINDYTQVKELSLRSRITIPAALHELLCPEIMPIEISSDLPISTGDGTLIYNSYIYICSRSIPTKVARIKLTDYTDATVKTIPNSNNADAIVQIGEFIWIGCFDTGMVYQLDPDSLEVLSSYMGFVTTGTSLWRSTGVNAMCADDQYIYIGGWDGSFAKHTVSNGYNFFVPGVVTGYVHSLCEDEVCLYGHSNYGMQHIVFKLLKYDMTLLRSISGPDIFHDDIVQDKDYIYMAKQGLHRFSKVDLSETVLPLPGMIDGLAMNEGYIFATPSEYSTKCDIHVIDLKKFELDHTVTIKGIPDNKRTNDILIDGEFLHLTRWTNRVVRLVRLNLGRIVRG